MFLNVFNRIVLPSPSAIVLPSLSAIVPSSLSAIVLKVEMPQTAFQR